MRSTRTNSNHRGSKAKANTLNLEFLSGSEFYGVVWFKKFWN